MKELSGVTVGVDISDKHSQVCVLSAEGEIVRQGKYPSTEAGITKALAKVCKPARVILEAGTHSPWMSRVLEKQGFEVIVADPRRLKLISQSATKNDRNDAEMLARLGRADVKLLKPIHHRRAETQLDLMTLKSRDAVVMTRTRLINAIRGMAKAYGARVKKCAAEDFAEAARSSLPEEFLGQVGVLLALLDTTTKSIASLDEKIHALAKKYPDAQQLDEVYGVGPITALAFVLTLEDKNRFKRSRSVGQYVGLCPRQDQSGDSDKQLRISKTGDSNLRRLLVGCAQTILRKGAPDSDLKRWGVKLATTGGKNAKKRAVIAVARKLAVLLHRIWVTGEEYEPLRQAQRNSQLAS